MKKLLTIIALIIICSPVNAKVNETEKIILKQTIENACFEYKNPCYVTFLDTKRVNAHTYRNGEIAFTTGILNRLNYDELEAVGMHEVGHHILKHYWKTEVWLDYIKDKDYTAINRAKFLHSREIEADLFATHHYLSKGKLNYLPQALQKIIPQDKQFIDVVSHPSCMKRVYLMRHYEARYFAKQYDKFMEYLER